MVSVKDLIKQYWMNFIGWHLGKRYIQKLRLYKKDLDKFIVEYNLQRTHQGKRCKGRTLMDTFVDGKKLFNEKNLEENMAT